MNLERLTKVISSKVCSRSVLLNLLSLFALILLLSLPSGLEAQSGTAFRDFNGDGVQTGAEPGVQGIVIKLYANATAPAKDQLIGETITAADGSYDFSVFVTSGRAANPGEPVRLEFDIPTNFECGLEEGVDFTGQGGEVYGTSVQFGIGTQSGLNFAINYPGQWVSTPDPIVLLPCYVFGSPANAGGSVAGSPALVQYNFLDSGVPAGHDQGQAGVDEAEMISSIGEVGALYGVAFSRQAQKGFAAAVMRRHAAFGPLGPGGIYLVDPFSPSSDKTEDWLDLDAIGILTSDPVGPYPPNPGNNTSPVSGYIGTDAERGLSTLPNQPSTDYAAGDQVGKVSLGDIDLSDDGRYLYVMNLYDRRVYEIDLVDPLNPQAPTLANVGDRVRSWPVPDPATTVAEGEERPWGLKYYRGKLYVGLVLSGQDIAGEVVSPVISGVGGQTVGSALRGYVFEFDTDTEVFTERLNFTFDYGREAPWIPWGYSTTSPLSRSFTGTQREIAEPIISDIEFDDQGSMLIGILDRKGHQYAISNADYNGTVLDYEYASAGELLRADVSFAGNDCVYNVVTRPGTTDFYNDNLFHPESVQGPLAVLPGGGDAMAVWLDPLLIRSGGTIRLNNNTGAQVAGSAYEVFDHRFTTAPGTDNEAVASKANGLGDVELGGEPAGIEIGNLVWADYDEDGIQDSGEPGVPDVEVELWSCDEMTLIATTTTNSDGGYYFNQLNVTDGNPVAPGNQAGPQPFTCYKIYVRGDQYGTGDPLGGFEPTLLDQVGTGKADFSDHDGVEQMNGDLQIMMMTEASGANDHTYDVGFICIYEAGASFIPVPANCDGLDPLNDGSIVLATVETGTDRYGVSPGAGPYAGPDYDGATAMPATFEPVVENVPNAGATYVIRVFAENNLCYEDYTVVVPPRTCPADPAGYIYCEDSGEIITGGTISVTPPMGGVVLITLDGSTGRYEFFNNGVEGVYTLSYNPPAGYVASTVCTDLGQIDPMPGDPNPIVLGSTDANTDDFLDDATCASNPFYLQFYLEAGDAIVRNNIPLSCGKLGNYVWEDNDLDGVQDAGEPAVPNIVVNLYECDNGVKGDQIGTTTTDQNGAYCFTGLPGDEEYCIEFDLEESSGNAFAGLYAFTDQDSDAGDDTNDSDADANGCTPGYPLAPGEEYEDFDAGLILIDLGDLPEDTGYNTILAEGGAAHSVPSSGAIVKIGATVDIELDGAPSPLADGDGADEDGFNPAAQMFLRQQTISIDVPVMNMSAVDAKLTMFVDWDNDGDFDEPEEMITDVVAPGETVANLSVTTPADAVLNRELGVRFRISTDMAAVMSADGPAPDGEVEDYLIVVMGFDYGDLVDATPGIGEQDYQTTIANGGPSHKLSTDDNDMIDLKLGASVDDELDGQPSNDADGDDTDEDGFIPGDYMFIAGQSVDLNFTLMNMTGSGAKLTVFIDWNNNGDFNDPGEMYFTDVPNGATTASINGVVPPLNATLNDDLGLRIRLSTDMAASMNPNGPAPDGEVEDYEILVMGFDYGDLIDPASGLGEQNYETLTANMGPSHKIITNEADQVTLKIGAAADADVDGQASDDASGDDADGGDDEDGLDTPGMTFITGTPQDITIPVMNMTNSVAKLTMFIDWNNDGDFDDADEMYSVDVPSTGTSATFSGVTPPTTATLNDDLGLRLRISTDMAAAMSPFGPAPDGEVEDHEVVVLGYDYGDLPDSGPDTGGDPTDPNTPANYETLAGDNGAKHRILTNENDEVILKMGAAADDEADANPSADAGETAGGDDNNGTPASDPDDEDALVEADMPLFILTLTTTLDIPVMNMTGEPATLAAFIDYNKDGFFDPATEKYTVAVAPDATSVSIDVGPIPETAVVGQDVGLRLRLANDMGEIMTGNGCAESGEIEDYMVEIIGYDFGDLPDSYGTAGPDGPRHIISEALKLGSCVDTEREAFPEAMAGMMEGGDDADPGLATFGTCTGSSDEDGIEFTHPFIPGNESCITVTAMNMTGEDAVLQVWIDWNGDGMFGAGEELAFTDNTIPDGGVDGVEYCFPVPADVAYSEGALFIRARLSSDGGLAPDSQTIPAPFGEIEDYKIKLSKVGSLVWEDYNGNGEQDEDASYGLDGVDVELLWYGPDGDVNTTDDNRTYTVTTSTVDGTPGVYNFCGLNPGTYSLSVPTLPTDFVPTWSDIPGDDVIDSDEHTGVEFTIVDPMGLPEGEDSTGDNPGGINGFPDMQDNLTFDFGAYIPAELGDYVWLDESFADADDTQVSTGIVPDVPIEGVTVTLMGTNNIGQPVMLTLVTDENGFYKFTDLAPGSYKVIFDASTALGECGPILLAVTPDVGGDDELDSDQNAAFTTPFYALFSGDDNPSVDAGFVEPPFEFACIANLNVTLGEDCTATITEDMILTGLYYCIDEFIIDVDGTGTDVVSGCGDHTYMITLIEDGVEVYTCWGNIFAEDKTDPEIDCPADTDEVTLTFDAYEATGNLNAGDAELNFNQYSCLNQGFLADGVHNYDVVSFTTPDFAIPLDVYTFLVDTEWGDGSLFLFQGDFNEDNPCENIIGSSDDAFVPGGNIFDPTLRLSLPLQPNTSYTLVLTNWLTTQFGDWTIQIYSDDNSGVIAGDFVAVEVTETRDLICDDIDNIYFQTPQSWVTFADGSLDYASTLSDFFGGNAAALDAFLAQLSLTGIPEVEDNCGPMVVTLSDVLDNDGDCGDERITRTFTVADRYDGVCIGAPRTASCEQVITFRKPTIGDLVFPPFVAPLECDEEFPVDANGNPHPSVTGYPWIRTAFGFHDLDQDYCNLGASYSDEPRIDVCEGTYKVRREWNIIDWCNPGGSGTINQLIKVGDFTGPVLSGVAEVIEISTSPFTCVANVAIPVPDVVDGNDCGTVSTTIYTILADGESFLAGGYIADNDVVNVPVGEHTLILCAEDACGNETCEEYTLFIRDEIEPTASCDDNLNVSIGGGDVSVGVEGIARIFAEDVDEGSYDNCGEVTLEVRRNYWRNNTCDASENRWSPWGEYVDFYCCDIANEITIELRVTDESGNTNTCWMTVTPEDKLNPYCYAPADVELTCVELPLTFPGDIEAAYDEDFAGTSTMMSALFGNASGTDNCAVDTIVERTPNIQINECGWGIITRRFEAWQLKPEGDVNGNGAIDINEVDRSTNSCSQDIVITEVHDFVIDFPQDADADCGDPDVPTIATETDGCDVLSINIGDPVRFSATGDECYKLSITYDVINWCLWDGEYTGHVLPRMTEDDGESLPVDRAVEANERPIVIYNDADGLIIDRDHERPVNRPDFGEEEGRWFVNNGGDSSIPNNAEFDDTPNLPNYGRYIYTQFVKVYDSSAPEVAVGEYGGPTANCPDLLPGQFGDDDGDCQEAVSIPFSVSDDCELFDNDGNLVVSIVSAELDAFAVDANGDGEIKANEFSSDADAAGYITDNGDGTYSFDGVFPIITSEMGDNVVHAVRILFEDGCGNQTSEIIEFDVIDCKGPAPICINGLTVTLMPQDDGSCAMAIWASDFEGSPIYDCTGQGPETNDDGQERVTKYAIYRAADTEDPDFVPNPADTGLVLTQDDEETTVIRIYAFDEEGNYDYCETYVLVQAHVSCGDGSGTIAGVIMTEEAAGVEGVEVNLNGGMSTMIVTNTDGSYSFVNLPVGGDYTVTPYLNANPLNGVTTFDLVKISKHILNVEPLSSPYKMIAADANRSNTITTLDMIQIRKLILNIITEFPNNTSWRFVATDHEFDDLSNPWATTFPELINENNLATEVLDADFVGIKVGDVNGSAQANALAGDDRNLEGTFHLQAEDIALKSGNTYTVAITGEQLDRIVGFQGTLQLEGVELVDMEYGEATAENFGLRFIEQGYLTMSWNEEAVASDAVLFSLVIRAEDDRMLSEVLRINDRYTMAEAYRGEQTQALSIAFTTGLAEGPVFELYQNSPNPFREVTMISFNLPEAGAATLTIRDAAGQLIQVIKGDYAAGYNTINVAKAKLNGASGVLNYTVESGEYRATRQMIVVQ